MRHYCTEMRNIILKIKSIQYWQLCYLIIILCRTSDIHSDGRHIDYESVRKQSRKKRINSIEYITQDAIKASLKKRSFRKHDI